MSRSSMIVQTFLRIESIRTHWTRVYEGVREMFSFHVVSGARHNFVGEIIADCTLPFSIFKVFFKKLIQLAWITEFKTCK